MAKYEAILISTQFYSVAIEADSEKEAREKAELCLPDLGTSLKPYDGDSYVDEVFKEE